MSVHTSKADLLHLYKRLLRACQTYPSKNRTGIYQSIQQEFRDHVHLQDTIKIQQQIIVAYKGLSQLHLYDNHRTSTSFSVQLEQNPFPKPNDYVDKRTHRVEEMLQDQESAENQK
jgi:Complex 1 protein (LYR family)